MSDHIMCWVTCADREEANTIGEALVAERLAACANILGGVVQSIFHWNDGLESANETVLILKSRAALFEAIETRVNELHSYDLPCVVAFPISAASSAYRAWIDKETEAPAASALHDQTAVR